VRAECVSPREWFAGRAQSVPAPKPRSSASQDVTSFTAPHWSWMRTNGPCRLVRYSPLTVTSPSLLAVKRVAPTNTYARDIG
jgi:hypothetical protein